jgi:hypothetical protein
MGSIFKDKPIDDVSGLASVHQENNKSPFGSLLSFQKGRKGQKLERVSPAGRQSLNLQKGCQKGAELLKVCEKGKYLLTDVVAAKRFIKRSLKRP